MYIGAKSYSGTNAKSEKLSDNLSHSHHNLDVTKPNVSCGAENIQMSPVTHHVTSAFHPFRSYCPQDIWFDNQFHDHHECTPGVNHRNVSSKEVPHDQKEIISEEVATIELAKKLDMAIHTKHPPIIIKCTPTALQEEMMIVEVPMVLPVVTIVP